MYEILQLQRIKMLIEYNFDEGKKKGGHIKTNIWEHRK